MKLTTKRKIFGLIMLGIIGLSLVFSPVLKIDLSPKKENTSSDDYHDTDSLSLVDKKVTFLIGSDSHQTILFDLGTTIPCIFLVLLQSTQGHEVAIANTQVLDSDQYREEQISKLRGKTLDIYGYLVDNHDRDHGIREIQRHFDYSSPNVVTYHLDKLYQLDLIQKTPDNRYMINPSADTIGEYRTKTNIGGYWIEMTHIISLSQLLIALIILISALLGASAWLWVAVVVPSLVYISYKTYKLR